jgi:Glycosyl hydrolases family 16
MLRPLVITVAALAALTLTAAPALAATPLAPAQAVPANSCANPVLAQNSTGWSSAAGSTSTRSAATGHPTAQYAFWALPYSGPGTTITLPAQTVVAGQLGSFGFDNQIAGTVRASVEWYSAAGTRISRVDGPVVTGTASTWVRATVSGTAPAGATRATVLGTGTTQLGTWWKSTNCTYALTGGGTTTTTTAPPTTTTAPPTTTVPPTTNPPTTTTPPTTTVPPTTTTPPTTTAPPTTTPPAGPGDGTQAAALYGWGPVVDGDEFATLNTAKWGLYNSPGHDGKGLRRPSQISVTNGVLTIAGTANGTTGGMSMSPGRKYGRWETRMQVPKGDYRYHPVALLWPDAENWPVGGEVDYAETTAAASDVDFFLHFSAQNRTRNASKVLDLTQWHNYAVEWTPTGIRGYIDGVQFFADTNPTELPPGPMHQTLQLDWFPNGSTPTTPSQMNVAWVRVYNV